jgi:hypothetical protein
LSAWADSPHLEEPTASSTSADANYAPNLPDSRELPPELSMKTIKTFTALVATTLLLVTLGCASTRTHEGTGQYVDDSVITTKVKSAILGEPGLKVSEINVETFKGVVQLSGFVSTREDINSAIKLAQNVNGVKSVKNDMQLK